MGWPVEAGLHLLLDTGTLSALDAKRGDPVIRRWNAPVVRCSQAGGAGCGRVRLGRWRVPEAVGAGGGYVFATAGDSFAVAFSRASDAYETARAAQEALATASWPGPELRVRMGLHLGEAEERGGDYFGPVVNAAARVEAAGHGGQILCTDAVAAVVDDDRLVDLGEHQHRGELGTARNVHAQWYLSQVEALDPVTWLFSAADLGPLRSPVDPFAAAAHLAQTDPAGAATIVASYHQTITVAGLGPAAREIQRAARDTG